MVDTLHRKSAAGGWLGESEEHKAGNNRAPNDYRMGFRYRLHPRDLPGSPDIAMKMRRKAIFVHGCFWHRHDDPNCRLARLPKSRPDFWIPKLTRNARRDAEHEAALRALGWDVLVVWECELRHTKQLENKLLHFIEDKRLHEIN